MMKLLLKFLLPFCFLFLGRYVYTSQTRVCHLPNYTLESALVTAATPSITSPDNIAKHHKPGVIYRTPSSNTKKLGDRIKATEIEDDDDLESFKKQAAAGSYCTTFFYALAPEKTHHYLSKRLPLCEHFSYFSSSCFIINCVFRI